MQPKRLTIQGTGAVVQHGASSQGSGTFERASSSAPQAAGTAVEPFQPGTVVAGKYLVERKLAEGGIGVIVVASHLELNRQVAIKYLKRAMLVAPGVVERFRREAQLAASIKSDHVVRVFDVGVLDDGAPYMVMEHLEGEDLGAVLARGALPLETAIDYVLQACDAIAEAHALGIVHRDLKPENLFLARRRGGGSIVKILDFGISKASAKAQGARMPSMTEANERFGTPVYMSPEQLLSSTNVDARADIWALGVVLFELLTTALPFAGDEMPQLCANILRSPATPLRQQFADASAELEAILLKCLEKDPACRYRNVAELAQDLVPFGPAISQHRVESIMRSVRFGGESIRPSALPAEPALVSRVTHATPRAQPTVAELVQSLPPPPPTSSPRAAKVRAVAMFAIAAAAVAALTFNLAASSRSERQVAHAASPPVGSIATSLPSASSSPPPTTTAIATAAAEVPARGDRPAVRTPEAPTAATTDVAAARSGRPKAPVHTRPVAPPKRAPGVTAPPAAAAAVETQPASTGDYSEFGERR
jgi:serine/threonine-protein kinase